MSAQGGTLRAPMHVPIRPVAVLLAAAIAGAIALSVSMRDGVQVTRVAKQPSGMARPRRT